MNTLLENLFEKYNLSDKSRYEINQIYHFLPTEKKVNLINNFEALALKLLSIEEAVRKEREILVDNAVAHVENVIEQIKKEYKQKNTRKDIQDLKNTLL